MTSLIRSVKSRSDISTDSLEIYWGYQPSPADSSARLPHLISERVFGERKNKAGADSPVKEETGGSIIDILSLLSSEDKTSGPLSSEALDNIIDNPVFHGDNIDSPFSEHASISVLDYLDNVYSKRDFYQSGHWDDAEDFTAVIKNVRLPDYDPSDFFRPVLGRITSGYGYRPSFGRMHKGVDLALNIGDTVRAALPGVVAKVGFDPGGYGHYVVMVHNNGMETRYAHLHRAISSPGVTLSEGDPLGLGGNSGNSTGPHLHFEIRYRGVAVDPVTVFNFYIPRRKTIAAGK